MIKMNYKDMKKKIAGKHHRKRLSFSIFSSGCKQYKSIHVKTGAKLLQKPSRSISFMFYFFFLVLRKAFCSLNPARILATTGHNPCDFILVHILFVLNRSTIPIYFSKKQGVQQKEQSLLKVPTRNDVVPLMDGE